MVKVFVEGGGHKSLDIELRQAFSKLFAEAGIRNRPRVVACGARNAAYNGFCKAIEKGENALLLVDSEDLVDPAHDPDVSGEDAQPWAHLHKRDGWIQPAKSTDDDCHLMVVTMETWLVADKKTWPSFLGRGSTQTPCPRPATWKKLIKAP
jgi:hypothetical protein